MRKFLFLILLFIPLALPARPLSKELEDMIYVYHRVRSMSADPGEFQAPLENLLLAEYVLHRQSDAPDPAYQDVVELTAELSLRYGYKFSIPPFSQADYEVMVTARQFLQMPSGKGLDYFERVQDSLRARMAELKRSVPVPKTLVSFPANLPKFAYPAGSNIMARPEGQVALSLNELGTGQPRIGDLFELMGTTEIGRELLGKFLPRLMRGEVKILAMTDETLDRIQIANPHLKIIPRALHLPNPQTGRAELHVDLNAETGVVLEELVHEIAHAVDKDNGDTIMRRYLLLMQRQKVLEAAQAEASRRTGKPIDKLKFIDLDSRSGQLLRNLSEQIQSETDHGTLLSEAYAYGTQAKFREQFIEKFPQAQAYYDAQLQRGDVAPRYVKLDFISYGYGIQSIHILRSVCRVVHNSQPEE